MRGFAQTRLELALGDLDTLRAALSAEGVGDGEIETVRKRHIRLGSQLGNRTTVMTAFEADVAHQDRAALLRKVDELTRAAKET